MRLASGRPVVAAAFLLAVPAYARTVPDPSNATRIAAATLGVDVRGIPLLCGDGLPAPPAASVHAAGASLVGGLRGWQVIPGAVRNNGVESFRLEVDANGPVLGVTLSGLQPAFGVGGSSVALHDDGVAPDAVAGDHVWTAGPFHYDASYPMTPTYWGDPESPAGVNNVALGSLDVHETDGTTNSFLIWPSVGILRADIPAATTRMLSPTIVATNHFVNVRTDAHAVQTYMRLLTNNLAAVTVPLYGVLPDGFDFLALFSTEHLESLPQTSTRNFVAGTHVTTRVSYTGTGAALRDDTAGYGSHGRLQSLNLMDTYDRGMLGNVVTHEVTHQWAAFIDPSLGLSDGAHYTNWSNVASLVGGYRWTGTGPYARDCDEGRGGAHHAPPLDLYMMGLVNGSAVAPLHVSNAPVFDCAENITSYTTLTIADIQARHGVRSPGPTAAQRAFDICFAAETNGRVMNATELTFYEVFAAAYTQPLAPATPDPYMGNNWPSVTRYFGPGVTWNGYPLAAPVTRPLSGPALECRPNPFRDAVHVALAAPVAGGGGHIDVYAVDGRRVRTLAMQPGSREAMWDGRDARGLRAEPGLYWVRIGGTRASASKVLLLR